MLKRLVVFVASICLAAAPALGADQSLVAGNGRPAAGGAPWTAAQIASLHQAIDAVLARRVLRGTHIGLIATAADSGAALYSRNPDEEFMPASNFKLLVGSAALQKLGTAFSFKTTVLSDGTNLYLRGGGDPLLTAKDLAAAAAQVAKSGITHVAGSIVTDATRYDSQRYGYGWSWDDMPYYYAPAVSALSLEENVLHVYMRPGAAVGDPVQLRIEPQTDAFVLDNQMKTGTKDSKDTSDIVRNFDDWKTITLTGGYPLGAKESGDLVPAVPDPARYAGDVFLRALRAQGVTVDGAVQPGVTPADAQTVWTHASEPLPQLLEDFWWPSDNLMGELLLKELGVAGKGAPGTDDNGTAVENAYLKSIGVDPATVSISDGSGLSQYDRITPRDLLAILHADWTSPHRDIVLDALPLSGVRGSLASAYKGTPAEKNVFAKTGSISHVRTISGFVRTRHHGTVMFSFMLDDWMEDAAALATLRGDLFSRFVTAP